MFPEPTELLFIGCLIESIWTPKIQIKHSLSPKPLADIDRVKFLTWWVESSFVCLTMAISVLQIVLKWFRKERNKMQVKKVTAKPKPTMNLFSRYSVRDPNVLASTSSESAEKTIYESQKYIWARGMNSNQECGDLWWALVHQPTENGTLRKSGFSRVDIWWNVGLKNGETRGWATVHPAHRQVCHWWRWYGRWHHHRIRLFAEVTVILVHGEWQTAKDIAPFLKRCNKRQRQKLCDMVIVYVFHFTSICIHWQELHSHRILMQN